MKRAVKLNKFKIKKLLLLVGIFVIFTILFFALKITFSEKTTSSVWDGTVAESFSAGSGTIDDPYEITNGGELALLFSKINSDDSSDYFNKYYRLENNIDLNNYDFSYIEFDKSFSGYINGNGYTISNFTLNSCTDGDDKCYYGLFYNLQSATIENFNFKNIKIDNKNASNEVISLIINSNDSTINNISFNNIVYNITSDNTYDITSSGLLYNDTSNNIIKNINIDIKSNSNTKTLFYNYLDSDINNIIYKSNDLELGIVNDLAYKYNYVDEKIIFEGDNTLDTILEKLNTDSNYEWVYENSYFRIKNNGVDDVVPILSSSTISSVSVSSVTEHESGVDGNVVYVNDYDIDYNYYMGLNYTYSYDDTIPTTTNKEIYSDSNLVYVNINYFANDIDSNYTASVSLDESQNQYSYFHVYSVNNNGTDVTSDDYIEFELIQNPFTNRPTDMGFNGWVTSYSGAELFIDMDVYVRKVRIPVSYSNNLPNDISIDFYASWAVANVAYMSGSTTWTTVSSSLESGGMKPAKGTYDQYEDVSVYYLRKTVSRGRSYPSGAYDSRARSVSGTCRTSGGCTYYIQNTTSTYDANTTYYKKNSGSFSVYTPQYTTVNVDKLATGASTANYFLQRSITINNPISGYYDADGNLLSGNCTTNDGCTVYELIPYADENGNENIADESTIYYYLVTRDINVVVLTGNNANNWTSSMTKPFTFTSIHNGVSYISSSYWDVSSKNITAYSDINIENMKIYNNTSKTTSTVTPSGNYGFVGNLFNVRIGRGITQNGNNVNFNYIMGSKDSSAGSSSNIEKYSLIIESGVYNSISCASGSNSGGYSNYVSFYIYYDAVFGNDYDRINEDNDNLDVVYSLSATFGGRFNSTSTTDKNMNMTVLSGSFGSNEYDNTTGIYAGGRGWCYTNVIKRVFIKGGEIYNLNGGPSGPDNNNGTNNLIIYIMGGTTNMVYGGAALTETTGNRIIQMTGGKVNYSIFGGSNGVEGTSSSQGRVNGDTFIYVGGDATVGDSTLVTDNTLHSFDSAEAGSVFGAGNGNGSVSGIGTVNNSYIVIDSNANILRNVYGGGNYGAVGLKNSGANTNIKIIGGTVSGNVYMGGNNNGAGSSSYTTGTNNITMIGGTIKGSIFGGSRTEGTIYGDISLNINNGYIYNDVYGGGEGGYISSSENGTYVNGNISVEIGNSITGPTISGNVYGGSAYGTVNATSYDASADSSKYVHVTVNNGNISGSVFGGAKGDSINNIVPYIKGDILVTINDGIISNVFGSFDDNGTPQGSVNVYLNGGTIGSAYGGGNKTSITETHIYQVGSTTTNLYGGSNQSGDITSTSVSVSGGDTSNLYGGNNAGGTVETTNVTITGGTIGNVLGGNNSGGNVTTSNLTINGGVTQSAFGGNNEAGVTTNANVVINSGTVITAYGGGNKASTPNPHITINGGDVTNVFGGGNEAVSNTTDVKIYAGLIQNVYGGGNLASVTNSYVNLYGGTIINLYGGGNQAGATTTNIISNSNYSPIVTNTYGGSNQSGDITTSNITINDGTFTNLFGGNNAGGLSSTTNVTINNGTLTDVYGGGNYANVGETNLTVNGGIVTNIYGGGNNAQVNSNSNVDILGGTILTNLYGGGNNGVTSGNTYVTINNGNINGSAYGGGNGVSAIVNGNTNISIGGNSVIGTSGCTLYSTCSVFGGGNAASNGNATSNNSTSIVNIVGATIYGNVYGGANTSVINGYTVVNIGNDALDLTSDVSSSSILINGTVFGGGEANASGSDNYDWQFIGVTQSISVNIDAQNYQNFEINGSIFGSGNASSSSGTSNINIKNYGTFSSPKRNISIQRTDLLTIDNSAIVLKGATDRTNEYSDVLFSLSIIKELDLKNNSTLFLETGANELRKFKSLTATGEIASVDIDTENKTFTRNVDNRIYMIGSSNKVLNIANERLTTYGDVTGMTFFGLYKYGTNDSIVVGMYGDYDFDEELGWGANTFTSGSYVLGAHKLNHDITVDGFYSNFIDENGINSIDYITPTPEDSPMYMWVIGEYVRSYDVNLIASKYSTLGAIELPLIDYTDPNTTFEILGVDYSALNSDVQLVDKNQIPKIASSSTTANNVMGLYMEPSTSGWLSTGGTYFYTDSSVQVQGTKSYIGENTSSVKSLLFYLYHSKNLDSNANLGTVQIILRSVTRVDDLTSDPETVIINVNISRALYTTNDYEASLTAGRKYELFTSTDTKITSKSSISAYYSLYAGDENIYRNGYHRALVSNFAFPEGTKITMIDLSLGNPKYYYHVITSTDYTNAQNQISLDNEADYDLSDFEVMGALNSDVYYNDSLMNTEYYDDINNYSQEEFIFIIDFEDTEFISDSLDNYILLELQDASNETLISVLGMQEPNLHYDIYNNLDAVIEIDGEISSDTIYSGDDVLLDLTTTYTQTSIGSTIVYDTKLFDEKMGLKLTLYNEDNEVVSGTYLLGLTYEINGVDYSPNIDGTTSINVADRVGNAEIWIKVKTGNSSIATGNYTLRVEAFGSADGIYFDLDNSDYIDFDIYIVNEIYGLDINTSSEEMVIDKTTGYTLNGNNEVKYNIEYNSGLNNPSIRIRLLRRKYDDIYSSEFIEVDISDYVLNNLVTTSIDNQYLVIANPTEETNLTLRFDENLTPGTYMVQFMLYDGNSQIGTIEKYIIIK